MTPATDIRLVSGRCLTARATHASHRAAFHRLGLSVGIAIALAGCQDRGTPEARADNFRAYCVNRAADSGPATLPAAIRECQNVAREIASGMSAGTDETQSGSGQSPPARPEGDAQ